MERLRKTRMDRRSDTTNNSRPGPDRTDGGPDGPSPSCLRQIRLLTDQMKMQVGDILVTGAVCVQTVLG